MAHLSILGQHFNSLNMAYPPNHPLSGSKHFCSICGDKASGKHYGVYSCEGCKGFFKRTVRKDLSYTCRENKQCLVDKLQRNRCQYCRYQKCLVMGMKIEAVQDERQQTREREKNEAENASNFQREMPLQRILEAERKVDFNVESMLEYQNANNLYQATEKQLVQLVEWAKEIPHFLSLPLEDQVLLLKTGWNELLLARISHSSIGVIDKIIVGPGVSICRDTADQAGIDTVFDRILNEMVFKMRELKMDKAELGFLRTIVLYNPEIPELKSGKEVEELRNNVYESLDEYTRMSRPNEPMRFAKLLLRLPSLRSIGLKCPQPLFFFRFLHDLPIDTFLLQMLQPSDLPSSVESWNAPTMALEEALNNTFPVQLSMY